MTTTNSTTERIFRNDPPNRLQDETRAIAALAVLEQTVVPEEPTWFKDYCDQQEQQPIATFTEVTP